MVAQSPKLNQALDGVFHALAHPARREMLRQLARGERNLTELAAPLEMSFPAASKHVRVLEKAQLVRRRVEGRNHICTVEGEPLAKANQWLEEYRKLWEANFQRLDAVLEELKAQDAARTSAPKKKPKRKSTKLAPKRQSRSQK
jgi:DNA-binding transcriptional ArsR family regulator